MKTQIQAPTGTAQRMLRKCGLLVSFIVACLLFGTAAQASRIKEVASIEGVRSN